MLPCDGINPRRWPQVQASALIHYIQMSLKYMSDLLVQVALERSTVYVPIRDETNF